MNRTFAECRNEYEEISLKIQELYAKQRVLQKEMQNTCPHERVVKVNVESFLTDSNIEKHTERYRCRDCFCYFTDNPLKSTKEA